MQPNGVFDLAYPTSKTRRGRVQMGGQISPTLTCSTEIYLYEAVYKKTKNMEDINITRQLLLKKERVSNVKPKGKGWSDLVEFENGRSGWFRIRKLTPKECLRLQGVPEHDIDIMLKSGLSDSRLYTLAGNSICVPCMVGIFRNMFTTEEVESNTLF